MALSPLHRVRLQLWGKTYGLPISLHHRYSDLCDFGTKWRTRDEFNRMFASWFTNHTGSLVTFDSDEYQYKVTVLNASEYVQWKLTWL